MKTIKALLTSVLLGAFIVGGCSTDNPPSVENTGVVLLTFNNADARTALPTAPVFTKYGLSAQKYNEDDPEGGAVTTEITGGTGSLSLSVGSWVITATGYVAEDKVAAVGASAKFVVAAGSSTPVNITLYAVTDKGNGVFTYAITPPSGVTLESTKLTFDSVDVPLTLGDDGKYTDSVSKAPGVYLVKLEMETAYQSLIRTEVAHIYSNRTTHKEWVIAAGDFAEYFTLSGTIADNPGITLIEAYAGEIYQGAATKVTNSAWSMALPVYSEETALNFKGWKGNIPFDGSAPITIPANNTSDIDEQELSFTAGIYLLGWDQKAPASAFAVPTLNSAQRIVINANTGGGKFNSDGFSDSKIVYLNIPLTGAFDMSARVKIAATKSGGSTSTSEGIFAGVFKGPTIEKSSSVLVRYSASDLRAYYTSNSLSYGSSSFSPSPTYSQGAEYTIKIKRNDTGTLYNIAVGDAAGTELGSYNRTVSQVASDLALAEPVYPCFIICNVNAEISNIKIEQDEETIFETPSAGPAATGIAITTTATSPLMPDTGIDYQAELRDYPDAGVDLTASFTPEGAEGGDITWSVDPSEGASVTNGKVAITAAGTYTVTAASGALSDTYKFKILPAVLSVAIGEPDPLQVSSDITLTATVNPADALQGVTWSVDNSNIATIDADSGVLTGVATGDVTVTATSKGKDANGSSVTDTKTITVGAAVAVTGVTIDDDNEDEVEAGGTLTLTATVAPENAPQGVTWAVYATNAVDGGDASATATINPNTGVLTAANNVADETKVYVFATSTQDGSKVSTGYEVTVKAAEPALFTWAAATIGNKLASVSKEAVEGGIKLTASTGSSDLGWNTGYDTENGYFVYIPVGSGDFEFTIKIDSATLASTNDKDKAGILAMVKDPALTNTANPGITSYFLMAKQGNKTDARPFFRDGTTNDAGTGQTPSSGRPSGVTYIKLKRTGTTLTGTYSANGSDWCGTNQYNLVTTTSMQSELYLGLLVTGNTKNTSSTVTFKEVILLYGDDLSETYTADFSNLFEE
ncbi:MAG: Ig-like domain-containing protein [Treponema sp.]|jgi:uncharacterized protein YjdB|nr:Ig-like domain-containing protein [Treponema sp.]